MSDANERVGVGRQTGSGRALVEVMEPGNLRRGDRTAERGRLLGGRGERTAAVVSLLTPGALDTVINSKEIAWAIVDEGMLAGPLVSRIQELWGPG